MPKPLIHKYINQAPKGIKSYRIPAIISLKNGNLLAFAEGRVNNSGDFGDINIVLKISKNQGKTWSGLKTIVDYNSLQAGNPAPVFDEFDPKFPKGRIFLFYNTGNNHENEVRKGNGQREVWFMTSVDGGNSWSVPTNITSQVHKPKFFSNGINNSLSGDWRSCANTPGHAIQLRNEEYRGRILVPANHSEGEPKSDFTDYSSHCFYTDDHGISFKISESLPILGSNEATAAELPNGHIILNARNQKGTPKCRIVAYSNDGGQSWYSIYFDKNLPDPVCEGSILNFGKLGKTNLLLFSNAADSVFRDNLTIKTSLDNGKTWNYSNLVDKSNNKIKNDFTAYSDLVKISKNKVGIIYERNNYAELVFKTMKLNKLNY